MPGGGSILGMIVSYRDNMRLRKKSVYNRKEPFDPNKPTRYDSVYKRIEIKELSEEQRRQIKEKTISSNRKSGIRRAVAFVSIALILIIASLLFLSDIGSDISENSTNRTEELKRSEQKRFRAHLINGDGWCERHQWEKAIEQYDDAIRIYPDNYEVKRRLAYAYLNNCKGNKLDCYNALRIINELIDSHPGTKELYELRIEYFLYSGEIESANKDYEIIEKLNE